MMSASVILYVCRASIWHDLLGARSVLSCDRSRITASLGSALEEATSSSRGGVVRETLIHNFPRLAGLMDDLLKKIQQDTDVSDICHWPLLPLLLLPQL